jgi:glutathione S-transferase
MLIVHHLRRSQSERIVWLCEELGLDYELKCYERNATDMLAPPAYKALHPMGIAPVISDDDVVLGESGAIVEYLLARHGPGRLARGPSDPGFASYLYWLHFANGTLQPIMGRNMIVLRIDLPADNPVAASMRARLELVLKYVESRCAEVPYLAGAGFSAADIMSVFSLSTMRSFCPVDRGDDGVLERAAQQRQALRARAKVVDPHAPCGAHVVIERAHRVDEAEVQRLGAWPDLARGHVDALLEASSAPCLHLFDEERTKLVHEILCLQVDLGRHRRERIEERLEPARCVPELREVGPRLRLADIGAVDLATQSPRDHDRLVLLVGGELLDQEGGRGVVAAKPIGLEIHPRLHRRVLVQFSSTLRFQSTVEGDTSSISQLT